MQSDAPSGGSRKIRITVNLDSHDYGALASLAEREERSLSWLVAQAVKQYLVGREDGTQYPLRFGSERKQ